jgi:hypothetical protein
MIKKNQSLLEKKRVLKDKRNKSSAVLWRAIAFTMLFLFIFSRLFSISIRPKYNFLGLTSKKGETTKTNTASNQTVNQSDIESQVLPSEGVELPITWGDLGKKMIANGVIDETKFRGIFQQGLSPDEEEMLTGQSNEKIVMTQANSQFILDMLWAFGLSNKNSILTEGEMTDVKYGGDASKFASTGGWSLSVGPVMNHYSKYSYVKLTSQQQILVDRVSSGIYRPCCGNSTHFPDCNHGMAMLGLLELMAANNVSEQDMYKVALRVNSYWFPQTYLDLATYFKEQGQNWDEVDPKIALGANYSSAQGYSQTRQKIKSLPTPAAGGGGCGV